MSVGLSFPTCAIALLICFAIFLSPVSVFSEVAPSESTEQASQSVPMVSTSTPGLPVPGAANTGDEGDDSLLEPDTDRSESLCCLSYSHVHLVFVQL